MGEKQAEAIFVAEENSPFAFAAEKLLANGFTPIPVMPCEKAPGEYIAGRWSPMQGWNKYAKSKPDEFTLRLWKTWPNANVGVLLGTLCAGYQLVCLDFDTEKQDEIDLLQSKVPISPMRKRGARGYTAFYRAPADMRTKRYMIDDPTLPGPHKKRTVLEVLTGNAPKQTVMPPSIHPNGNAYEWGRDDVSADETEIIPVTKLPILTHNHIEAIEDALRNIGWATAKRVANASRDAAHSLPTAANDDCGRNPWRELNELALQNLDAWVPALDLPRLRKRGNGYECVATWRASNGGNPTEKRKLNLKFHVDGIKDMGSDDGYTAIDAICACCNCTASEAFTWLQQKLGRDTEITVLTLDREIATRGVQHVTEAPDGTLHDTLTGEVLPPPAVNDNSDEELPDHLTRPPGLLGDVTDWIVKTARSPNRVLALGAAITVLGTLAGRRDGGPTNSGTALYVLCLGPSGCGKQHGLDQIQRLMIAADAAKLIGSGEAMSATAVWNQLLEKPLSVSPMDEFGDYLKRINSKRAASHEAAIAPVLRKAWGAAFSPVLSPSWAGRESEQAHCLAMSIYAVATPHQFYNALTTSDLENGTLNRFLILSTMKDAEEINPIDPFTVPEDIAGRLKTLYERDRSFPALPLQLPSASAVLPVQVPWAEDGVEALYQTFRREVKALRNANPETADCYARTVEMALRLATIVAVGRSLERPSVSTEDFKWGRDLAMWSSRKLARDAGERVSDTETGARWSKIVARLRRSGGQCDHTSLSKHMKLSPREFREALEGAESAGLIDPPVKVARSDGKPGKQKIIYRIAQNNRTAL